MLQAPYTNLVMDTKPCVDRQVSAGKLGARAARPSGDVRAWHVLQGFYTVPATSYPCIIPEESSGNHTGNMDTEDINPFPKSTGKVTHPQFLPPDKSGGVLEAVIVKSEVVTVFLRYRDKVLVLKRSRDVGTYRGRWAGVSGYIEEGETPLEAAEREVREETGISKASLVREGRPLSINDLDRIWIIHPFLFDAITDKLTLDWEHDAYRWIEPGEVKGLNTVPGLYEALREVLR